MHPRIEELTNSQSPVSPLRRRSSIIPAASVDVSGTENDDEAERKTRRLEKQVPQVVPSKDKRRSLSLSLASGELSNLQIAEKVSQCMKLSVENKINTKNAFSLEMIDFMNTLIKKKDPKMSNLQVASTSLDVSAKIYGFRVDRVHQDVMKMMGGMNLQEKKKDRERDQEDDADNQENEGQEDNGAKVKKKKKKRSKQQIISNVDFLRGVVETVNPTSLMMDEQDSQTTDMLYQARLPFHANSGIYLNTHNDVIFDVVDFEKDIEFNDTCISFPKIQDFSSQHICPSFANFKFLGWGVDDEAQVPQETQNENNEYQFDFDASLPADEEPADHGVNFFDLEDDENQEGTETCAPANRKNENLVDLRAIVTSKNANPNSEYSYFQGLINIQVGGPSHWKIGQVSRNLTASSIVNRCGQAPIKKRKDTVVKLTKEEFSRGDEDFGTVITDTGKQQKLARTRMKKWKSSKIRLPAQSNFEADNVRKFYLRPETSMEFPRGDGGNATYVSDDVADYDYNNENDTTNYCPNIDNEDQRVPEIGDNNGGVEGEMGGGTISQAFTGDNLVEAPRLTCKTHIAFSQRAKKIDMKALKDAIWKNVKSAIGDEGSKGEKDERTAFSETYKDLPNVLSKSNAEVLSVPLAYMSLLHLSNEKSLQLDSVEGCHDIVIRHGQI